MNVSRGGGRRLSGGLAEINVTPLVDVILVLLIIFMVTAPMMQRGIDVALPQAKSATGAETERLVVTVDRTNRVWLNETPVALHLLQERLQGAAKSMAEPFVYLRADRAVPYGDVMAVMDRIKQAGIERVGLVTEPLPPGGPVPKPRPRSR
ncbi:MAG: biopolymer transporter ExbD [Acidobacteria bacterium]|nr:biopolymer transporter ExbD [Acidobacteriota bacterium]